MTTSRSTDLVIFPEVLTNPINHVGGNGSNKQKVDDDSNSRGERFQVGLQITEYVGRSKDKSQLDVSVETQNGLVQEDFCYTAARRTSHQRG